MLRQCPIDRFIVDCSCAALRLMIEVDGEVHDSTRSQIYHEGRSGLVMVWWDSD